MMSLPLSVSLPFLHSSKPATKLFSLPGRPLTPYEGWYGLVQPLVALGDSRADFLYHHLLERFAESNQVKIHIDLDKKEVLISRFDASPVSLQVSLGAVTLATQLGMIARSIYREGIRQAMIIGIDGLAENVEDDRNFIEVKAWVAGFRKALLQLMKDQWLPVDLDQETSLRVYDSFLLAQDAGMLSGVFPSSRSFPFGVYGQYVSWADEIIEPMTALMDTEINKLKEHLNQKYLAWYIARSLTSSSPGV